MLNNQTFYPTPLRLINKMISKIQGDPCNILEPSAGKGDIIEKWKDLNRRGNISAIENNKDLRATLRGKCIKVIDSDFLSYSGPDKFDLIIANPPFDDGDKHLLKAIDIMFRGEIVFLLNAETIKNPYTNIRKDLARKLKELNADIEYIDSAFMDAERKSKVEIALVYINIEHTVENDLFADVDDKATMSTDEIKDKFEVSTGKGIKELVAEYNEIVNIGTDTIINYFRNYKKISKYIGLNDEANKYSTGKDLTEKMQHQLNEMLIVIRKDFWRKCLDLKEVRSRMTAEKMDEFEDALNKRCDMDFTESNIRSFVLNLIGGYEQMLTEAVLAIFKLFSYKHSWDGNNVMEKNIHYFNGWKTNKAFKVGKKVILPIYGGYDGGPFVDSYSKKWKLSYGLDKPLRDIDVVMNYFDGMSSYLSILHALEDSLGKQISRDIHSTYFDITVYKKGTIHLTFNDENILRRFNVAACRGKGWLSCDYGEKGFAELTMDERSIVESFEGRKSYTKNLNQPIFAKNSSLLQITD